MYALSRGSVWNEAPSARIADGALPGTCAPEDQRLLAMLQLRLSDACWLQPLEESHANELYALIDANRAYLSRWMPWAASQSADDTVAFIRDTRRQLVENDGIQTAIVFDGEIIGVVGFHVVDWTHRKTSIGYWLGEKHQGNGTMTLAVDALVNHALRTWQLNRVEICAAPDNHRSRAIPERLGFLEDGVLRQDERIGDRYLDSVVYSMLASDWRTPPH